MIIRSIFYFKTGGERRATKGDQRGRPSTTMRREWKKRVEVRRLTSLRDYLNIAYYLIGLKQKTSNEIDMRVAKWRADGITGNSVVLISCLTSQIILIRNTRPIVKPIGLRNNNIVHIQLCHSSSIINAISAYSYIQMFTTFIASKTVT